MLSYRCGGSRVNFKKGPTHRVLESWVYFMNQSADLKPAIQQQANYFSGKGKGVEKELPYNEYGLIDLAIFTSNLVRSYQFLSLRFAILKRLRERV